MAFVSRAWFMAEFIPGRRLSQDFFSVCARPILEKHFPGIPYSTGLIGYGSDVLGYDDEVSTDHMWGPRFYLFLRPEESRLRDKIMERFSEELPYTFQGYSVNFSSPNPEDHGIRSQEFIDRGKVAPLIFIQTFEEFLKKELNVQDLEHLTPFDWLSFSEHRLLSLKKGIFFVDHLQLEKKLLPLHFYPDEVKYYLIASNWGIIAEEQAFVKRTGKRKDEIGSRLLCSRLVERLMRLCFLYRNEYAPYSKWFGTAFWQLDIGEEIKAALQKALEANSVEERESFLVEAQVLVAKLHNESGITPPAPVEIQPYFGRDIKVIFADKLAEAAGALLEGSVLRNVPFLGSFSQVGGLTGLSDDQEYRERIKHFYLELSK